MYRCVASQDCQYVRASGNVPWIRQSGEFGKLMYDAFIKPGPSWMNVSLRLQENGRQHRVGNDRLHSIKSFQLNYRTNQTQGERKHFVQARLRGRIVDSNETFL